MAERDDSKEPSSALGSLLELEADIAHRLERARACSEASVLDARSAVEAARADGARELAQAMEALRHRLASEHRQELVAVEARARAEAKRFDSAEDDEIRSLADTLLDYLFALTSTPILTSTKGRAR